MISFFKEGAYIVPNTFTTIDSNRFFVPIEKLLDLVIPYTPEIISQVLKETNSKYYTEAVKHSFFSCFLDMYSLKPGVFYEFKDTPFFMHKLYLTANTEPFTLEKGVIIGNSEVDYLTLVEKEGNGIMHCEDQLVLRILFLVAKEDKDVLSLPIYTKLPSTPSYKVLNETLLGLSFLLKLAKKYVDEKNIITDNTVSSDQLEFRKQEAIKLYLSSSKKRTREKTN